MGLLVEIFQVVNLMNVSVKFNFVDAKVVYL